MSILGLFKIWLVVWILKWRSISATWVEESQHILQTFTWADLTLKQLHTSFISQLDLSHFYLLENNQRDLYPSSQTHLSTYQTYSG
jgi:hypothetical protein